MGLDQVIGKNIKAFREHLNYTQQEISDYLGISQPAYVKYEKGETIVPLEAMEKLASLYNVEEYDLMEENDQLFQTSVACAYRKTGNVGDLSQISQFQKIVKNYIQMCDELEK
ncbi:helix-turn-helix transcriptional regulator [uncultured Bacteroides sp.]|uniref:helix-turn-helix domain-containing protein n=1 Tax=uncultured Bacteroides sp. TaxID=162156 RepID=UPI00280A7931|nr:helix-turn-helix transcriptional regulator [uncultured Bacteroides sp.]